MALTRATKDNGQIPVEIPVSLLCPISGEMIVEPVIASDGHTYDMENIQKWLEGQEASPVTRNFRMSLGALKPDQLARTELDVWRQQVTTPFRYRVGKRDPRP
eukprot:3112868-Pyramimonas_sp.AAC.2